MNFFTIKTFFENSNYVRKLFLKNILTILKMKP